MATGEFGKSMQIPVFNTSGTLETKHYFNAAQLLDQSFTKLDQQNPMACLSIIFHTLLKGKLVTKLAVTRPFLGLNPFLCLGFESHHFFLVESNLVSWEIFVLTLMSILAAACGYSM